jgi:hypothetical protein
MGVDVPLAASLWERATLATAATVTCRKGGMPQSRAVLGPTLAPPARPRSVCALTAGP